MKPIFECWCIFLTKVLIYDDKIVISRITGTKTIPMRQVAQWALRQLRIQQGRLEANESEKLLFQITPWTPGKRQKIVDIVFGLIS